MDPIADAKFDLSAPHFPFRHSSTVEKVAEYLDKFTASLFNWQHDPLPHSSSNSHTDVEMLRCELDQIDEKIRFTFLQGEIFRRGLKTASEAYKQLNSKREEKLREIDEIHTKRGYTVQLPPEILMEICAHAHNTYNISLQTTLEGNKTWGTFIFKSSALWISLPEILGEQGRTIAKQSSELHVVVEDQWVLDHVMSYPSVLENVHRESWSDIYFRSESDGGHDTCFALLENCAEYLPEMKNIGFWCKYASSFHDDPECRGCVQGVEAGRCTGLHVPLTYLPCISQMFVGGKLRYLTSVLLSKLNRPISWYLSRLRVDSLVSLAISGSLCFLPDDPAISESDRGIEVAMPCLRRLFLWIDEMRCNDVISIMSGLRCNELDHLELHGLLAQESEPTMEEDIHRMLKLVDGRCKKIRSLRLHVLYSAGSDPGGWGSWHGITPVWLRQLLQSTDDGRTIFPMMNHMLIPYRGGDFEENVITDFLVKRKDEYNAPIHNLEIAVSLSWSGFTEEQRGGIERLGLYVHTVVVSNATVH